MRYASVCDGIGAVHVAWKSLGWECAWTSEIEPFPAAVVEHHFGYPNLRDMTKITQEQLNERGAIELLVGGTPCQSFSVAGLRGGLDDARGNLALRFLQLAAVARPEWLLWENVPGVLSSGDGRDFGCILGGMGELGYGFAFRVLDAQYFGVPQRRRRVFVVGCLGGWQRAAAVLFERYSLSGHPAPSRETGARVANAITRGIAGGAGGAGGADDNDGQGNHLVPAISPAIKSRDYKGRSSDGDGDGAPLIPVITHALKGEGHDASEDGTGRGVPIIPTAYTIHGTDKTASVASETNIAGSLRTKPPGSSENSSTTVAVGPMAFGWNKSPSQTMRVGEVADGLQASPCSNPAIVFPLDLRNGGRDPEKLDEQNRQGVRVGEAGEPAGTVSSAFVPGVAIAFQTRIARNGRGQPKEITDALTSCEGGTHADSKPHVAGAFGVRRLTPRECERLQGFPDDYTAIIFRGKLAADAPRYKALGNSMAVPVMKWIGERIAMVDALGGFGK